MSYKSIVFILFFVLLFIPTIVFAFDNSERFVVEKDEVVNENIIKIRSNVSIEGTAAQDVVLLADSVRISGKVLGNVFAVARDITIGGDIQGSVYAVADRMIISGKVAKNLYVMSGDTVELRDGAEVGWDFAMMGNEGELFGDVNGRVDAYVNKLTVGDTIGKSLYVSVGKGGQIVLLENAVVSGDLVHNKEAFVDIRDGAHILGNLRVEELVPFFQDRQKFWSRSELFSSVVLFFRLLIVGMVLIYFAKKTLLEIQFSMLEHPIKKILLGLLFVVVVPLVCLLLAVTIIGLPLAFIAFGFYLVVLYISRIFIGLLVGREVIHRFIAARRQSGKNNKKNKISDMWTLALGLALYLLVGYIPFVGWTIKLILVLWAFGAIWFRLQKYFLKIQNS